MFTLIVFLGDAAAVSPELWPAPHVVITDMVRIYSVSYTHLAIMRLKLFEKDISRIEACMGRYSIRKFPKAYVIANCSDLQEGLRTWFKLSSTIPGLDMAYFYNVLTYTCLLYTSRCV